MAKQKDPYRLIDSGVDLDRRVIYLGSERVTSNYESGVDAQLAEKVITALDTMNGTAPGGDKPITVILNNPGGDVYHMLAIYDAIKASANPVDITVYGMAMSAGSIILQAGRIRTMSPNARLMIHFGTSGQDGHPKIVYNWAEESKKIDKLMANIYLERIRTKHPEFSYRKIEKLLDFDTILGAQETIDLGLADQILK